MEKERRDAIHKEAIELGRLIKRFDEMDESLCDAVAYLTSLSLVFTCIAAAVKGSWKPLLISALIFGAGIAFGVIIRIVSFLKSKLGYESEYSIRLRMKRLQKECPHGEYLGGGKRRLICSICCRETVTKMTKEEKEKEKEEAKYLYRPGGRGIGCDPSGMPWDD